MRKREMIEGEERELVKITRTLGSKRKQRTKKEKRKKKKKQKETKP